MQLIFHNKTNKIQTSAKPITTLNANNTGIDVLAAIGVSSVKAEVINIPNPQTFFPPTNSANRPPIKFDTTYPQKKDPNTTD